MNIIEQIRALPNGVIVSRWYPGYEAEDFPEMTSEVLKALAESHERLLFMLRDVHAHGRLSPWYRQNVGEVIEEAKELTNQGGES